MPLWTEFIAGTRPDGPDETQTAVAHTKFLGPTACEAHGSKNLVQIVRTISALHLFRVFPVGLTNVSLRPPARA